MRTSFRAVGYLTASLSLASAAFAAPASNGWTSQAVTEAPAEAPVKLNPTGRTYEIAVPLKVDGARLGDVGIEITPDDKVFVDAKLLRTYLGKIYLPEALNAALPAAEEPERPASGSVVSKKAPGASGSPVQPAQKPETQEAGQLQGEKPAYLPVSTLKERGIDLRYDPLNLELEAIPAVDQRPTGTISFKHQTEEASAKTEEPAYVSAYLNLHLGARYVSQNADGPMGTEAPTFDFDGAMRIGPYVFEAEGAVYSLGWRWFSPRYFQDYVFYRRGTRLVYDLPDEAIRIRVGDLAPNYEGFQSAPDILGVSANVAYAQLQPQKSIRPTGAHSFRIERPSMVDILVDNALVKRIRLGPGNYNLTDLPLNPGANDVKLVIEDDTGERRTLEFTGFSGHELLAPGISEWAFSAGVKSYDAGAVDQGAAATAGPINTTLVNKKASRIPYAERQYFLDEPVAMGFYRTGVFDWLTVDANGQADAHVAMAGADLAARTTAGLIMAKAAASEAYSGRPGFAVQLGYDYDKLDWFGYASSLRLLGEYRSRGFGTVGTYQSPSAYNAFAAATYAQHLPWDLTASLSFSYYFADASGGSGAGDRWQADVTVATQLSDQLSASVALSYGDDRAQTRDCYASNRDGFQAFLRVAWTPEAHASAFASMDSQSRALQTSVTESGEKTGIGAWTATATAEMQPEGQTGVSASASYFANRAEFYVAHSAGFSGRGFGGLLGPASTQELTSLGVATSVVYADGAFGLGRRVTGGFALITPHESLEGSPVLVGESGQPVAETDWLGAAVVPSASPYRPARLTYDAPDAPAGYDLGSAAFDMKAPYKAGYRLKAGSAYTVTAMGTLLDAEGQPLPLLAGEAREANKDNGRKVELFTNRAGIFGAQGLAPGNWIIEMPGEQGTVQYALEIPEGVTGLHQAGTLKPSGGQQKPPIVEAEADNATN